MSDARNESQTTTPASTTTDPAGGTPQVQVYDSDRTAATGSSAYGTPAAGDLGTARGGLNWGAILLVILLLAAAILLITWIF